MMMAVLLVLQGMTASAAEGAALTEAQVMELAEDAGKQYNICPELLQAIAWRESKYDPRASNGGCEGLMQVSLRWHKGRMERLGVTSLYDPADNMLVAADYLAELFAGYGEADVVLMYYSGNSRADEYSRGTGEMSAYVEEVLEESAALERSHGK